MARRTRAQPALTDEQLKAIANFTLSPVLFNRTIDEGQGLTKEGRDLIAGLAHLPPFDGVSWRGERWYIRHQQDLEGKLKLGTVYSPGRFVSTSLKRSIAETFATRESADIIVLFRVRGKSGRNIASISKYPDEREVLFAPGAAFRIMSVVKRTLARARIRYDVELEEI